MQIANPVLTGFNPDPSIIRVEDKYYIANSTFEWFPGVQIHESTDLVNWTLISHPLDTIKKLDMDGNVDSGGIWAPDLSYADGRYWLVYTDVKVVNGAFKDCTNYLTTADDIRGPWSDPITLNGVGFDASLFHDDDGRKYLVQMVWDFREYKNPVGGIKLTEYDPKSEKLLPRTAKVIYHGSAVKLTEGPHIYKLFGQYYLFCAEGGTAFSHHETVSRSNDLWGPYKEQPGEAFLTAFGAPDNYLQKCGHGALVDTPDGEWYFAHLCGRPLHRPLASKYEPRGYCTLGRETAIQKVTFDADYWPHIVGGRQGQQFVEAPKSANAHNADCNGNASIQNEICKNTPISANSNGNNLSTFATTDTHPKVTHRYGFDEDKLDINLNTLRIPFTDRIGSLSAVPGSLRLYGKGSLSNTHEVAFVARRWQAFEFVAETKVKFDPYTFQQMAGLVNFYNTEHWSFIHVTHDETLGRAIELSQMDNGVYTSFLRDKAIAIPDDIEYVYFRSEVHATSYKYSYSFDGVTYTALDIELDATILSDDYIMEGNNSGCFTGAFVGLAAVDIAGYNLEADFAYFVYDENL
ncbi:MAG: glycoside hydrolase family 43 protein [Clostridiales Family XIII bacterium]|jgi:xylan 1,4-beta-xylosidase|nr:glycoside hydrolase family 43 protein [Clostridiales Family XIII bacterium]